MFSILSKNNSKNETLLFTGTDSEKLFQKNKKTQSADWIYRTKSISYKNNNLGFRNKPLDEIDWANSVVVFGCSNTYGVGLAEEDTFCYILEKKLNIPIVNLGMPGSAIDLNHYNSVFLYKNLPTPKAVVHCWTSLYRYSNFEGQRITTYYPKDKSYRAEINWEEKSKFYVDVDRVLWENKTVYKECSFFNSTAEKLNVVLLKTIDFARDLLHPGIESNKLAAEIIYQDLSAALAQR